MGNKEKITELAGKMMILEERNIRPSISLSMRRRHRGREILTLQWEIWVEYQSRKYLKRQSASVINADFELWLLDRK